ncbi:hypothetical protein EPUS_02403 [Endocarpon pusillum Z07020]|uniref:Radical SAM core domain-containing protein n=1 Tax=Endocarpon pusillum (strain Z07020 / HMAS-L-300199) TaxID=1263415 RepID=U1GGH6_ENDPU|nr:uncharacterized protein EPUS_02403 [Endocarpon pusillum Z07020]ERF70881.1 hypothetical protein EPUS_02403 [Endocarpon pusillum Z07020]
MTESAFKQPLSLLLRQEWNLFGRKTQWAHKSRIVRTHVTAPGATTEARRHQADIQWIRHDQPTTGLPLPHQQPLRLREETNPRPLSSYLTDDFSRAHNYLRISVTERCNLRCVYCMPENGVPLSPSAHLLTTPEIVYLSQLFVSQGVDKIRLTGGEPTVRKDIIDLMTQIGRLRRSGLKELCLTTNGLTLHRKLDAMVEAGLTGVNLSLDTLDPYQFTIMTRRNGHEAVTRSIERILEMNRLGAGIKLKINCVVMRGINEREIIPFVELGKNKDIEVRFIEYMPFDGNKWSQGKMLSFKEMLATIREKYPDLQKIQDHKNDTSKTYQVPGFLGKLGFITSMTHNFCGTCNRLRITSDGNLKVCLFGNSEVSLRDILRERNNGEPIDQAAVDAIDQLETDARNASLRDSDVSEQDQRLLEIIGAAVKRKKAKHAGMGELENMKNRPMILIDDHYSAFTLPSFSRHLSQEATLFSPQPRPYVQAPQFPILPSIPFGIQLRRYHTKAREDIISLRNTNATKPKKPKWLRPVHGQGSFRKIPSPDPVSWITPSEPARTWPSPVFGYIPPKYNLIQNPRHEPQLLSDTYIQAQPPDELTPRNSRNPQKDSTAHSNKSQQVTTSTHDSATEAIVHSALVRNTPLQDSGSTSYVSSARTASSLSTAKKASLMPSPTRTTSTKGIGRKPNTRQTRNIMTLNNPFFTSLPGAFNNDEPLSSQQEPVKPLSHLTSTGDAHMVDISHKPPTRRAATAKAFVLFSNTHPYTSLTQKSLAKGDATAVARLAGIQAAKKTADLIPLAHPSLGITGIKVDIDLLSPSTETHAIKPDDYIGEAGFEFGGVKITAYVSCDGKTGVEMEALTAANMAALTMYDMCKSVDKHMVITGVRVTMKKGGKSGPWSVDGDIPNDPPPAQIFESVLQRRMAGLVDEPEAHGPVGVPDSGPEIVEQDDGAVVPEADEAFLQSAATELELFIANTTSPTKAAEIAGLRRSHKSLSARIKELQRRTEQGYEVQGSVQSEWHRDGRVDHDILQRLHGERREIARKVLEWRIGGGSEVREADKNEMGMELGSLCQRTKEEYAKEAEGQWRWEAGVYGVWRGDQPHPASQGIRIEEQMYAREHPQGAES